MVAHFTGLKCFHLTLAHLIVMHPVLSRAQGEEEGVPGQETAPLAVRDSTRQGRELTCFQDVQGRAPQKETPRPSLRHRDKDRGKFFIKEIFSWRLLRGLGSRTRV